MASAFESRAFTIWTHTPLLTKQRDTRYASLNYRLHHNNTKSKDKE